jgi:hypothetical protein
MGPNPLDNGESHEYKHAFVCTGLGAAVKFPIAFPYVQRLQEGSTLGKNAGVAQSVEQLPCKQ